jgi:hypothetical protein
VLREKGADFIGARLTAISPSEVEYMHAVRHFLSCDSVAFGGRFIYAKNSGHYRLKSHLISQFKISNDPHFAEKLEDVVGLYL